MLPHELPDDLRLRSWEIRFKRSLVSSLSSGNKTLAIAVKNYVKADIRIFSSYPILTDFLTLFQIFCLRW